MHVPDLIVMLIGWLAVSSTWMPVLVSGLGAKFRLPIIVEDPNDVMVKKHEPTTLNCKAEGIPTPTIEWYKDGDKVRTTGNRMLLPSGALFFLHVIHNKRDADTGTYWCLARNEFGRARSRNATVSIASPHKHPRISEHPADVVVNVNEAATLSCKAEGKPTPAIEWFKDGHKVRITDNMVILPSGSLFFLHVRQYKDTNENQDEGDSGAYWCTARNELGKAKSQTAYLRIDFPTASPPLKVLPKVNQSTTDSKSDLTSANRTSQDREYHQYVKGSDTEFKDALRQPWFIIITALTVMFITSSAVLIFLMRQISIGKKPIYSHVSYTTSLQKSEYGGGQHSGEPNGDLRDAAVLWLDQNWETATSKSNNTTASPKMLNTQQRANGYANKMSEYSVIGNDNDIYEEVGENHGMSTFGKKEEARHYSQPSPYAMTTIISIPGNSHHNSSSRSLAKKYDAFSPEKSCL